MLLQYSYSFFTCFCDEYLKITSLASLNFLPFSSKELQHIIHKKSKVRIFYFQLCLFPLRCIRQCQGCKANKRSVYANPSTYILCLHMRALYDLTGWHAWALASLLWLTICPEIGLTFCYEMHWDFRLTPACSVPCFLVSRRGERKRSEQKMQLYSCYAGCIVHRVLLAWERLIVVLSEFLQSDSWKKGGICVCPMAVFGVEKKINLNRFK